MALYTPTPLEPAWESLLARVASRSVEPHALALMVSRLSRRYLGEAVDLARSDELLARLRFFFPRDVQKPALPIAELAMAGALASRPLRVLDLGAGVGASSAGVVRTLADPSLDGGSSVCELHLVDRDGDVLARARSVFVEAERHGLLPNVPQLETRVGDLAVPTSIAGSKPYDLIVLGNALVEVTRGAGDESARGAAIADLVAALVDAAPLAPDGTLIALEPATRPETRALHRARAALIERGFGIFAPCTHGGACPMLARDRDWCHEDLAVDLPDWLDVVARDAGLRWEGLTFSYLAVRRDRRSVGDVATRAAPGRVPIRAVSTPRESKGKTELLVSGPFRENVTGARLMQLDRDVKRAEGVGARLSDIARGDLLALDPQAAARTDPDHPLRVAPSELTHVAPLTRDRSR